MGGKFKNKTKHKKKKSNKNIAKTERTLMTKELETELIFWLTQVST